MAYANIKRPNRRSQFEIGNPSTKGNLSSRNSKAAQNFVLTPKERAIIEAERKRKAAERESGWYVEHNFSCFELVSPLRCFSPTYWTKNGYYFHSYLFANTFSLWNEATIRLWHEETR